jgi:hypothetical protein
VRDGADIRGPEANELFDVLNRRKDETEAVMRTVPGLVSYTLIRRIAGKQLARSNRVETASGPGADVDQGEIRGATPTVQLWRAKENRSPQMSRPSLLCAAFVLAAGPALADTCKAMAEARSRMALRSQAS